MDVLRIFRRQLPADRIWCCRYRRHGFHSGYPGRRPGVRPGTGYRRSELRTSRKLHPADHHACRKTAGLVQ